MKKLTFFLLMLAFAFVSFSFIENPIKKYRKKSISTSLAFPVAGKKSKIGDRWGASRDGGRRRHKGIDIYARKGTPVVAISDGIIVERAIMPVGGKTLWLKTAGDSWTAYYAHLDKQLVKEGQYVRKGQVIGTVGNTGNALHTPSHLHFGIDDGKGWVNPMPYIKNSPKVVVPKATVKKKATTKKTSKAKKAAKKKRTRR